MVLKRIRWFNVFPIVLGLSLLIGIVSNIVAPINIKLSCLILIGVLVLAYGWRYLRPWLDHLSAPTFRRLLVGSFAAMVVVQLIGLFFFPVTVYHDPFRVLLQAELISRGQIDWHLSTYFWRYPNNVVPAYLLGQWLKLPNLLGLSTNAGLHLLALGMLDSLIAMLLAFVRAISWRHSTIMATLALFALTPLGYAYYSHVVYTDLPMLWLLTAILLILWYWKSFNRWQRLLAGGALLLAALLGQLVKPSLIIMAVAIGIMLVRLVLVRRTSLKHWVTPLVVILLGLLLAAPAKVGIEQHSHYQANPTYQLPAMHWIWMSYNPRGNGTYMPADVKKMLKLPTTQARQKALTKRLPARLKRLGPVGIVKRWIVKQGILLNVHTLSHAYTGGLVSAPRHGQRSQLILDTVGQLTLRIGFIFMYWSVALQCFGWLKRRTRESTVVELAAVTAVGLIAFYTLLWESENRYGQVLIPLLLIVGLAAREPFRLPQWSPQRVRGFWVAAVVLLGVGFGVTQSPLIKKTSVIVAAQRSQLSVQYGTPVYRMAPHSQVTQRVDLLNGATHMSVLIPPTSRVSAQLVSLDGHRRYQFAPGSQGWQLKRHAIAGQYRIVITNAQSTRETINYTQTKRYRLAPYAVNLNGHPAAYSSLIYKASRKVIF